jgi:hypothetical protein
MLSHSSLDALACASSRVWTPRAVRAACDSRARLRHALAVAALTRACAVPRARQGRARLRAQARRAAQRLRRGRARARADQELRTQVAQLKDEYARVGDQLESEQTRIMQARRPALRVAGLF